jgi:hypothetical protein
MYHFQSSLFRFLGIFRVSLSAGPLGLYNSPRSTHSWVERGNPMSAYYNSIPVVWLYFTLGPYGVIIPRATHNTPWATSEIARISAPLILMCSTRKGNLRSDNGFINSDTKKYINRAGIHAKKYEIEGYKFRQRLPSVPALWVNIQVTHFNTILMQNSSMCLQGTTHAKEEFKRWNSQHSETMHLIHVDKIVLQTIIPTETLISLSRARAPGNVLGDRIRTWKKFPALHRCSVASMCQCNGQSTHRPHQSTRHLPRVSVSTIGIQVPPNLARNIYFMTSHLWSSDTWTVIWIKTNDAANQFKYLRPAVITPVRPSFEWSILLDPGNLLIFYCTRLN